MSILLIIPYNRGTVGSVSFNLYKSICAYSNQRVLVVCLDKYSSDGKVFDNCIHLGALGKLSYFKKILLLKNIKKKYRIRLSISTLIVANYLNVLSGIGEYKIGLFHTSLEQLKLQGLVYYYMHYLLHKILCKRLDKKIAVNKTALLNGRKILGQGVELVYNIHDFEKIRKLSREPLNESEQNIFAKPVILYAGSGVWSIKAPDRLMKAYSLLEKSIRESFNLVYIGAGNGDTYEKLKGLAEQYKTNFYYLGYQQNPYKFMKRAQMLVSPSRDEGLPGVVIEALALGTKCICTNSSEGVWEIMECDQEYDKNLVNIKKTKYGYIVPNNIENEDETIRGISRAILECMITDFPELVSFNTKRFESGTIVTHYINCFINN